MLINTFTTFLIILPSVFIELKTLVPVDFTKMLVVENIRIRFIFILTY